MCLICLLLWTNTINMSLQRWWYVSFSTWNCSGYDKSCRLYGKWEQLWKLSRNLDLPLNMNALGQPSRFCLWNSLRSMFSVNTILHKMGSSNSTIFSCWLSCDFVMSECKLRVTANRIKSWWSKAPTVWLRFWETEASGTFQRAGKACCVLTRTPVCFVL